MNSALRWRLDYTHNTCIREVACKQGGRLKRGGFQSHSSTVLTAFCVVGVYFV